jgi:putative phosphoesterase
VRIGIVSDIHGNAAGLACALERMGDVDELLCAGDVVEEYRFDNESVALLRARGARVVLGNHDVGFLGVHGARARAAVDVDPELVAWLASQPLTIDTTVHGKRLVLTHASPCAPYTQYVIPHSAEMKRIGQVDADLVVIGHTHRRTAQRVGRPLVINPGSVGQARDPHNGRRLSYAVLELSSNDDPEIHHVHFDDYTVESHTIVSHTVESHAAQIDTHRTTTLVSSGAGGIT